MHLTTEQVAQLQALHKREQNGKIRDRIKAVLAIAEGYSYAQVAKLLLLDDDTIRRHVNEYLESQNNNHKGSESKLNHKQSIELIAYLQNHTYS